MLYILGLGPGDKDLITPMALDIIRNVDSLVLRTDRMGCAEYIGTLRGYDTLDDLYESCDDFDELCAAAAKRLTEMCAGGDVAYCVFDVADATVDAVVRRCVRKKVKYEIVPGVPVAGTATAGLTGEYAVMDALNWDSAHINPRAPLIIREIDDRYIAAELKVRLMDYYPGDTPVEFYNGSRRRTIKLSQLDRQADYDHMTSARIAGVTLGDLVEYVYADRADDAPFDFDHLIEIVRRLRAPDGCPWDREQTPESLRRTLIEESYEAVERIDRRDWDGLYDELGDVLMQVALQSQIADEYGRFNVRDVTRAICKKLIYRHSHVFGEDKANDPDAVQALWEERKRAEKGTQTTAEAMQGISRALPALMRAEKVLAKAFLVGFGGKSAGQSLAKVSEETRELSEAIDEHTNIEEELGDLLLACVSAATVVGVDAETALAAALDKYIARFTRMERAVLDDGREMTSLSPDELDGYWDSIKRRGVGS